MAKKYLSLEEAAAQLRMPTEELNRLREKGEIRGFSDRGNWKFRGEDVDELERRRQTDSDPDVPLLDDEIVWEEPSRTKAGPSRSDSDVRLVADRDLKAEISFSDPDLPVTEAGTHGNFKDSPLSDSDVALIESDSDSDVSLSDSDSDVRLADAPGSDSDVRLVGGGHRDTSRSDSDVALLSDDNDFDLGLSNESAIYDDDDDLVLPGDSALRLSGDSGVQLRRPADSGIVLGNSGKSGLLGGDSGQLLFSEPGDSGVARKAGASNRKNTQRTEAELDVTAPLLIMPDEDNGKTPVEVPLLDDEDDARAFSKGKGSVIMFDDEDDVEEAQATVVRKRGAEKTAADAFALDDEDADEVLSSDELSGEVVAEDDEASAEDFDAFEEADEDFEEEFEEGGSTVGMSAPSRGKVAVTLEREWSALTFASLAFSLLFLVAGAVAAADLTRATWSAARTGPAEGGLAQFVGGFFK